MINMYTEKGLLCLIEHIVAFYRNFYLRIFQRRIDNFHSSGLVINIIILSFNQCTSAGSNCNRAWLYVVPDIDSATRSGRTVFSLPLEFIFLAILHCFGCIPPVYIPENVFFLI